RTSIIAFSTIRLLLSHHHRLHCSFRAAFEALVATDVPAMSYTVERPDRPAAEVAAAHDDAPSRTLLGSASTFTARLLESAKARAELLQSQAQVTMAAASERIRG
ncbi:hypothetical protein HaLaN_13898, partial [Haematococcus lacustris]